MGWVPGVVGTALYCTTACVVKGPVEPNSERNEIIRQMVKAGMTPEAVGRVFKLSRQRVHQLLAKLPPEPEREFRPELDTPETYGQALMVLNHWGIRRGRPPVRVLEARRIMNNPTHPH